MANNIAYTGSDKWKQKATELLNQGGGGGGLVDDVKVNGTSVVDANKVAQIDLTPYAESADLATVATTGSYDDLTDKPTIPAAQVQSDWLEADTSAKSYIQNKPTIPSAQVQSDWNEADSSAVDYIKNKPTIPTVNDGTLTLKNGDQTKGTFGANQSTAANVVMLPFDITGNTTIGFTPIYPS